MIQLLRHGIYKLLNTALGRRVRRGVDQYLRAHPYWRTVRGVKLKFACATDIDVNRRAMHQGLGYDADWVFSQPVESLIDLGCNTGLFALWVKAQTGRAPRGIAVDANPEMCARARDHFTANEVFMDVHHGLVGEPGETGVLHTHSVTVSSSTVGDTRPWGAPGADVTVPCLGLVRLWGLRPFDLLKVDIEGSEHGLFKAEQVFCAYARRIVVEWHEPHCTLAYIRQQLYGTHRLIKFHTHNWSGTAYFEHL